MKRAPWLLAALGVLMAFGVACAPAPEAPPAPAPAAPAAPPEPPFYEGKTMRIIVGFAAGGGYDTYYRLIAKHMGKYIPGNPSIVVENMTGGGSLIAANHLYKVAKPDGLTVASFDPGLILSQLLGGEGIEFEAKKFNYLGTPTSGTNVCIVRSDRGFKTIQDAIASPKPIILGGTAPGSDTDNWPKLMQAALGANIKLVSGYSGTATIRRAIEAGEVEGGCWGWESIKPTAADILQSGLVFPIVQHGLRKHPDLPDVPLMIDLVKTDEGRAFVKLVTIPRSMARFLVAPPGTPQDRVKTLREGLAKTLKDPELLAEAEKAKLEISSLTAEDIGRFIDEMFNAPPEVLKKLAEVLK